MTWRLVAGVGAFCLLIAWAATVERDDDADRLASRSRREAHLGAGKVEPTKPAVRRPAGAAMLAQAVDRWQEAAALEGAEEDARRSLLTSGSDASIDVQLDGFLSRLIEKADADPTRPEGRLYRARALEVFLRRDAVQARLAEQSADERRSTLAHLRKRFGYSPQDITRLEARDRYKDARWDNGLAYMKARADLVDGTFGERTPRSGDARARDDALAALRTRFFDHEAETIAREEAAGFFRFRRRRVYGRN